MINLKKKTLSVSLCLMLSLGTTIPFSSTAYADVRSSDQVGGVYISEYVEETAELSPDLDAERICMLSSDKEILFVRNADEECKIASVTKIMTAIVAVEYNPDLEIIVSEEAYNTPGSTADILAGDKITVKEAIKGLMLPSGNDIANAIAEAVGSAMWKEGNADSKKTPSVEESRKAFVHAMNKKAEELGMDNTVFENPCGLDDEGYEGDQHSTAYDVALMTLYAQNNSIIADIVSKPTAKMKIERDGAPYEVPLESTNSLLPKRDDALGMKTGFTDSAGNCFAGTFEAVDDKTYVTVILGADGEGEALAETDIAWDWIDEAFRMYAISYAQPTDDNGNILLGSVGHPLWTDKSVDIALSEDPIVHRWYWQGTPYGKITMNVPEDDVTQGMVVGKYEIYDGESDQLIQSIDIVATNNVEKPGFLDSISIWWQRFIGGILGWQTVAEDVIQEPELMLAWDGEMISPDFEATYEMSEEEQAQQDEQDKAENMKILDDDKIKKSVAEDWDQQ